MHISRLLRPAVAASTILAAALLAPIGLAQTPTPTPTPTPTVPPAVDTFVPATAVWYGIINGGRYDAANMVLDPDGTVWTASALENDVVKLWADRTKVTKWVFPNLSAAPSSLYKDSDGTFWITELGGFNVAHLDPATGTLTEWADTARRPTALVRAADGTFWLPETSGSLARFDPSTGTFKYFQITTGTTTGVGTTQSATLSYPYLDSDGSVWSCDFINGAILKFAPDGASATRWKLPTVTVGAYSPTKIIRGPDGKLWISMYGYGQLGQFDPATGLIRFFQLPTYSTPFDLKVYKERILYSEQTNSQIGLLDPNGTKPVNVKTLTPESVTPTVTSNTVSPTTSTITSIDVDVSPGVPLSITGSRYYGLAAFPASNGAAYGLAVDEARGRIFFGTFSNIGSLVPLAANATTDDQYLPAAASAGGSGGAVWKTQTVFWNRGSTPTPTGTPTPTPTATPTPKPVSVAERLYPSGWIAGLSPAVAFSVPPNQLVSQADPIGTEMQAPGNAGALRFSTYDGSQGPLSDLFVWGRVYTTRSDGGTYGFAQNAVKASRALAAPEQAFFFAPEDTSQRTNGGFFALDNSAGTVSVLDASGQVRGSLAFDWPSGYHWQASTVFSQFGLSPLPSARVVFGVTKGRILPFGMSIDPGTNDPINLDVFPLKHQATWQAFPGVARGGGPMGSTSRTDLQLFNPNGADAHLTLTFRPAVAFSAVAPGAAVTGTLTVPAGATLFSGDVLAARLGLDGAFGTLELSSDAPVYAFARVTAAGGGGRFGFGLAGRILDEALLPPSRGVFPAATDNGWDVTRSDLYLFNPGDAPVTATLNGTDSYGTAVGTRSVTVGPHESRTLAAVWFTISGFGADVGRVDVVPSDGSGPLFAGILRQDQKTLDTDAIVPFVIPR